MGVSLARRSMGMALEQWLNTRFGLTLVLSLIVVSMWTPASGEPVVSPQSPPSSSVDALVLHSEWSSSERWAWDRIAVGRPADFDVRFGTSDGSGRKAEDRFADPRRRLSAGFLRTILTSEGIGRAVPREGVRIRGAVFESAVDVRDAVLARPLEISDSRFAGEVVLNRLRTPTSVSFVGSEFQDTIWLDSVRIGGNLGMHDALFARVVLKTAVIDGDLNLSRSRVGGELNLNGTTVRGTLFFKAATLQGVDLTNSTIGRQLHAASSEFSGTFEAAGLSTGGHVLMNEGSKFGDVLLRGARIGGQLSLSGSTFAGQFDGQSLTVGQDLHMGGAYFEGAADIALSHIAGGFDVGGATFTGLNLTGATVAKDFGFGAGGETVRWTDTVDIEGRRRNPMLFLWNASVGGLVDNPSSWPENLQIILRDFTYERLTPLPGPGQGIGVLRDADWYVDWLARDSTGSFQPYRQLARVLASYGADATARTVLIAGRERHRTALPWWSPERWFLFVLHWTIGYGYGAGELRALYWALLLLLLGAVVARSQGPQGPDGERLGFWYSLDMLLPGMRLSERHARVELARGPRFLLPLPQARRVHPIVVRLGGLGRAYRTFRTVVRRGQVAAR